MTVSIQEIFRRVFQVNWLSCSLLAVIAFTCIFSLLDGRAPYQPLLLLLYAIILKFVIEVLQARDPKKNK
jgi:hypothetical protein